MPNIKRMGRTMAKMKIAPEIMAQIDFNADDRGNNVLTRTAVYHFQNLLRVLRRAFFVPLSKCAWD